MVFKGLVETT